MYKIVWLIALLSCIFLGDRLIAWGFKEIMFKSQFRYSKMYKGGIDADILIIGNSRGVNSFFQPEMEKVLKKEVINMSYNGLRMDVARVLIEDYIRLNKAPEIIVLEASVLTKAYPELIKEFKPYAKPENALFSKLKELYPKEALFSRVSHVFSLNSELYFRSLFYLNKSDQEWINNGIISKEEIAAIRDYGGTGFEINDQLLKDIIFINNLCKEKGVQLKLILSPYLPAYIPKIVNLEDWKREINLSLNDLEIIDHSSIVNGNQNFADWVHLNKEGSVEYINYLNQIKLFK